LNLEIKNEKFTKQVEQKLMNIIEGECIQITRETYRQEMNLAKRIVQGAAYNMLRFMLVLFTFRKTQQL
jgi:hypothetical protein